MRCDKAQEFVSAVFDGEAVPHEAAEHLAACVACQQLLESYAAIGTELRRFGSAQLSDPVPERTWVQPRRTVTGWWEKGWQVMRVPRIAFASMVVLLVMLGSRLALVEVRAHEDGTVLLLKLTLADGRDVTCSLSATDKRYQECSGIAGVNGGELGYFIQFVKKDGDRALVSVRSRMGETESPDAKQAETMPETQLWVGTGQAAETSLGGAVKTKLTALWTDHLPVMMGDNEYLDPAATEIRLTSPLLLKDNQVAGDMKGSMAIADHAGEAVFLYIPGEGRFVLSMVPMPGAVAGKIEMNRISFPSDGHTYVMVTGAPVARGEAIWVKREKAYAPPSSLEGHPFLGAGSASEL